MPDERQEIQLKRPASHTMLSTFCSYTTLPVGTQGFVNEFGSLLWRREKPPAPLAGHLERSGASGEERRDLTTDPAAVSEGLAMFARAR